MNDIYFSNQSNTQQLPPIHAQQDPPQPAKAKRKKRFLPFKILFALLLAAAIVFTAGFGYIYNLMSKTDFNEQGNKENVYVDSSDLMQDVNVVNILFIGVDARVPNVNSRSDSMLLFSIDKNNKKIKLTSFMRDMWVDIPGRGFAKLNAACTYGGAQYVIDTIEYNFNIKIDSYILVDFQAFMTIIDRLGGVNVEVTEKEAKAMRDEYFLKTQAGDNVHLDGNEALWYSRIRYLDSDFMRTFRQRKVMTSVIEKAKSTPMLQLIDIMKDILPVVETDLNPMELTKLAVGAGLIYIRYDIDQARIPADDTWKNATKKGQSVLETDIGANQTFISDFLYKPDSEKETTTSNN
jgi:polyisoprenyl-teichoic acid--peptidoglycan teichoic acid transferase